MQNTNTCMYIQKHIYTHIYTYTFIHILGGFPAGLLCLSGTAGGGSSSVTRRSPG